MKLLQNLRGIIAILLLPCLVADPLMASGWPKNEQPPPQIVTVLHPALSVQAIPPSLLSQPVLSRPANSFLGLFRSYDGSAEFQPVLASAGARWVAGFLIATAYFHLVPPSLVQHYLWHFLPVQILLHEIVGHGLFAKWGNGRMKSIFQNSIFLSGPSPSKRSFFRYIAAPLITITGVLLFRPLIGSGSQIFLPFLASFIDLLPIPGTDMWHAIRHKSYQPRPLNVENKPLRLAGLLIIASSMIMPGLLTSHLHWAWALIVLAGVIPALALVGGLMVTFLIAYQGGLKKNAKLLSIFAPLLLLSTAKTATSFLIGHILWKKSHWALALIGGVDGMYVWLAVSLGLVAVLFHRYWSQPERLTRRIVVGHQKAGLIELGISAAAPPQKQRASTTDVIPSQSVPRRPPQKVSGSAKLGNRQSRMTEHQKNLTQPSSRSGTEVKKSSDRAPQPVTSKPVQFSVGYVKVGHWIKGQALFEAGDATHLDPVILSGLQRFLNTQQAFEEGDLTAARDMRLKGDLRNISELSYGDRRAFFRFAFENGAYTVIFIVADFKGSISRNRTGNYKKLMKDFLVDRFAFMSFNLLKDISIHVQDVFLTPGHTHAASSFGTKSPTEISTISA